MKTFYPCIIKEEDVNKAVRALHEKFIEEN